MPRPVVGRRLEDDEVAAGRRRPGPAPGPGRRRRARDPARPGSVSTESTAAVAPSTRSWPAATTRPSSRTTTSVHRDDPVVEVLAADQLRHHVVQLPAAPARSAPPRPVPEVVHLALVDDLGALAAGQRGRPDGPSAAAPRSSQPRPASSAATSAGVRPQQRRRLVRPAGVPGRPRRRRPRSSRRPPASVSTQPVVVPGVREVRVEHRDTAGDVAHPDGPPDRQRREEGQRPAEGVVRAPAATAGPAAGTGRRRTTARDRQRPVEVREAQAVRVGGHARPRSAPGRSAAPGRRRAAPGRAAPGTAPAPAGAPAPGVDRCTNPTDGQGRRAHRPVGQGRPPVRRAR